MIKKKREKTPSELLASRTQEDKARAIAAGRQAFKIILEREAKERVRTEGERARGGATLN